MLVPSLSFSFINKGWELRSVTSFVGIEERRPPLFSEREVLCYLVNIPKVNGGIMLCCYVLFFFHKR